MSQETGTNRADRIGQARSRLAALEPEYERITLEYENAKAALKFAESSYDIGERVRVTRLCRRGCCVEWETTGVVERINEWRHSVRQDNGYLRENVSRYDMERLP